MEIPQEKLIVIHEFVYAKFARYSGLMNHEFCLHFDEDLTYNGGTVDFIISAGKIVHIALRCSPLSDKFTQLCRHIFKQRLRPFIRNDLALVPKKDADKWVTLAVFKPEDDPGKKVSHRAYSQEIIVSVKLIDRRTKKTVIVEVGNSDMFTVKEKALYLLYGEKLS
jgi:hypothetical protein